MSKHLIFVNHTADHSPGDVITADDAAAKQLVDAAMARTLTDEDVAWLEAVQRERVAADEAEAEADDSLKGDLAGDKPKTEASHRAKAETAKQA